MLRNALMALGLGLTLLTGNAFAGELQIVTEESAPLNYTGDDGKTTGMATEMVQDMMKRMGKEYAIKVMPWARGYSMAQKEPNVALYSTTRMPAREELFKWVGPLAVKRWVLIKKKGNDIAVNSLDDAKKLSKIGTYKDDAKEIFLKKEGFTNLASTSRPELNLKMLVAGRIDAFISDEREAKMLCEKTGVDPNLIEPLYVVKEAKLYMAFSRQTDDAIVQEWQKAYDAMVADGTFKKITDKWMSMK